MTKPTIYHFGSFRLDLSEELLFRDGAAVNMQRKTFKTLALLVENSGRMVEKEQFFQEIWPDAAVEDGSLTVNISLLRKTLGDDQKGHKFIETVSKRGYRFVAPVRAEVVAAATNDSQVEVSAIAPDGDQVEAPAITSDGDQVETSAALNGAEIVAAAPRDFNYDIASQVRALDRVEVVPAASRPVVWRKYYLLGTAVVILALGLGYWLWPARPRTITVLPFRNLKPEAPTDFLSYSLAEEITTKLGGVRLPELTLVSTAYRGPQLAAEPPQTDLQLTGTYLMQGDEVQVIVRLIETASGEMLWQEPLEVREAQLPRLLDQVARRVMARLGARLTEAQAKLLEAELARDPVAYGYYLEGIDRYAAEDFNATIELLKKSVALDPSYARAWDYLGSAQAVRASTRAGGRADYEQAEAAFQKAIALNPAQPRPQVFLANLLTETNRVEEAVQRLREVLAQHPHYAPAQWELSYAYRYGGLLEESVTWGERALAADPSFRLISPVLITYLYQGHYEKFLASLAALKDKAYVNFYRGFAHYHLQDFPRAQAAFARAYELDPALLQARVGKALSYGLAGQPQSGLALLALVEREVAERGVQDAEGIYKLAQAYAVLGDKPAALRTLRRSITGGFFCYPYLLADPLLVSVRGEPEYNVLLATARQRHEALKNLVKP